MIVGLLTLPFFACSSDDSGQGAASNSDNVEAYKLVTGKKLLDLPYKSVVSSLFSDASIQCEESKLQKLKALEDLKDELFSEGVELHSYAIAFYGNMAKVIYDMHEIKVADEEVESDLSLHLKCSLPKNLAEQWLELIPKSKVNLAIRVEQAEAFEKWFGSSETHSVESLKSYVEKARSISEKSGGDFDLVEQILVGWKRINSKASLEQKIAFFEKAKALFGPNEQSHREALTFMQGFLYFGDGQTQKAFEMIEPLSKSTHPLIRVEAKKMILTLGMRIGGISAPEFELENSETGAKVKLSDYKGKVVLLDFWQTWCGPCVQQIPNLQRLHTQYSDAGLIVLGITDTVDKEEKGKIKAVRQRFNASYPQLSDDGYVTHFLYNIWTYPALVIVDRDGVIRGINLEDEDLEKKIQDLL